MVKFCLQSLVGVCVCMHDQPSFLIVLLFEVVTLNSVIDF